MNTAYIYALRDPRDGTVFYVGKTVMPWKRLKGHMRTAMCKLLVAAGFSPMLHLLEQCVGEDWRDRERYWIAEYKRLGHALFNRHPGGNSRSAGFSHPMSDATRMKLSSALKGKPLHPAFIAQQSVKRDMRLLSEMSVAATRGVKRPESVRQKIRASNRRTWSDPVRRSNAKVYGKIAAEEQWAGMSEIQRKEYVKRIRPNPRACFKDITAQKFYKLTAMWPICRDGFRQVIWLFQCECGTLCNARSYDVRSGNTTSCGCNRRGHREL